MVIIPIVELDPVIKCNCTMLWARFGGQSSLHEINWPFVFNESGLCIFGVSYYYQTLRSSFIFITTKKRVEL